MATPAIALDAADQHLAVVVDFSQGAFAGGAFHGAAIPASSQPHGGDIWLQQDDGRGLRVAA
jgi:hypothetical protein